MRREVGMIIMIMVEYFCPLQHRRKQDSAHTNRWDYVAHSPAEYHPLSVRVAHSCINQTVTSHSVWQWAGDGWMGIPWPVVVSEAGASSSRVQKDKHHWRDCGLGAKKKKKKKRTWSDVRALRSLYILLRKKPGLLQEQHRTDRLNARFERSCSGNRTGI